MLQISQLQTPWCFNSRTREGCDIRSIPNKRELIVSIHAPARGAIYLLHIHKLCYSFNSRTREGCDEMFFAMTRLFLFQFTHPRGVRCHKRNGSGIESVSIHAPARGAIHHFSYSSKPTRFQFTHPRGVRSCFYH